MFHLFSFIYYCYYYFHDELKLNRDQIEDANFTVYCGDVQKDREKGKRTIGGAEMKNQIKW